MLKQAIKNAGLFCSRVFICLLLLLPSALSYASTTHPNLSSLMCSPSGQAFDAALELELKELAELLGETNEEPKSAGRDCDKCTLSFIALSPSPQKLLGPSFGFQREVYVSFDVAYVHKAHGPPTGSRAPPHLI